MPGEGNGSLARHDPERDRGLHQNSDYECPSERAGPDQFPHRLPLGRHQRRR